MTEEITSLKPIINSELFERIVTAKSLKEREDFNGQEAWYVENVIPKGTLCYMIGTEKSFKSTTMLDLALAISSGSTFIGEVTNQAKVLYIQPENTAIVEHMRLKQTSRESTDNLHMLMYQFQLDNVNHMRDLYRYIRDNEIKVVILDNLKDLLSSQDALNDMTTANAIIKKINRMKTDFQDVTFIITHHTSKQRLEQSLSEKDFYVLPSMGLGSSAWSASYEVCLTLSPKRGHDSQYSVLTVFARNFTYKKRVYMGYVADQFTYILPNSGEKKEVSAEEAKQFLEDLDNQGKLTKTK